MGVRAPAAGPRWGHPWRALALAVALGALVPCCGLDDRELAPAAVAVPDTGDGEGGEGGDGGAGADAGEGGDGGEGADAGEGGAAGAAGCCANGGAAALGGAVGTGGDGNLSGAAGQGPVPGMGGVGAIGPCIDADLNEIPDCDQEWILSATFDLDVQSFAVEPNIIADWDHADAGGDPLSGSLKVTNTVFAQLEGAAMAGVSRCVGALPSEYYRAFLRAHIPPEEQHVQANLSLFFYESKDCTGSAAASVQSTPLTTAPEWSVLQVESSATPRTQSVLLRIAVIKRFRDDPAVVFFDDVRLKSL